MKFRAGWLVLLLVLAGAVACERGTGEDPPSVDTSGEWLTDVTRAAGPAFRHVSFAEGSYFLPEIMGPGVALLDYDGDGDLDIYALQGSPLTNGSAEAPSNRLFANRFVETGELSFDDVTDAAGLADTGYGMGAAVGDVDNDGDPDLYVTNFGANVFYRNNGDGRFETLADAAGAGDPRWSTSAVFLDYDRDGDLDLYVTAYVDFSVAANKVCGGSYAERDYCSPVVYPAIPDRLFRNDGSWRFVDVSAQSGIDAAFGAGLGVTPIDYDTDAGSISTSPTIGRRTSSGAISGTVVSRRSGSCRVRRTTRWGWRRPAWV